MTAATTSIPSRSGTNRSGFGLFRGWLGVWVLVAGTQTGHFGEHAVQMVQIHVMDRPVDAAHGLAGAALDIEWLHFAWNWWVLLGAVALAVPLRRSPLIWAAVALSVWHATEHTFILAEYLRSGTSGSPGLLADGGVIGGGLPLRRPELHFLYNLVETLPLVAAGVPLWRKLGRHLDGAPSYRGALTEA